MRPLRPPAGNALPPTGRPGSTHHPGAGMATGVGGVGKGRGKGGEWGEMRTRGSKGKHQVGDGLLNLAAPCFFFFSFSHHREGAAEALHTRTRTRTPAPLTGMDSHRCEPPPTLSSVVRAPRTPPTRPKKGAPFFFQNLFTCCWTGSPPWPWPSLYASPPRTGPASWCPPCCSRTCCEEEGGEEEGGEEKGKEE